MLTLADAYAHTVDLTPDQRVSCDVALSKHIVDDEHVSALYTLILEKFPMLWQALAPEIQDNHWILKLQDPSFHLSFSLVLVNNHEIQQLNRDFRDKDQATDVLTFSLLENEHFTDILAQLPEVHLGEIYVSINWAKSEVCKQMGENVTNSINFFESLSLFILERIAHGSLHLLGVHHDTMSDYNKVVAIQKQVLHVLA